MKLSEYKSKSNLSYRQLADMLGITHSKLHRICKGVSRISLADAKRIEAGTKLAVTVEDLL